MQSSRFPNCAAYSAHYGLHHEDLRTNLDRCSVRRNTPKLFDLFVGECDATGGPITQSVKRSDPPAPILNSMDHDVESG